MYICIHIRTAGNFSLVQKCKQFNMKMLPANFFVLYLEKYYLALIRDIKIQRTF